MKKVLTFGWIAAALSVLMAVLPFATARAEDNPPPRESDPNDQPVVTINAGDSYSHQYGPMPGQDSIDPNINGDVDPATCRGNQELTCNVIPIEFTVPPGYSKLDTYVASVVLNWDPGSRTQLPTQAENIAVNGEELDMYLWHNPECPPKPKKCDMTVSVEKSSGSEVPEHFKIDVTAGQHWQLVVNHANGTVLPNGYNLSITTVYAPFVKPNESLESTFRPHDASADAVAITPSFNDSGGSSSGGGSGPLDTTLSGGASGGLTLGLTPGNGALDPSIANLSGSGLPDAPQIFKRAAVQKPPKHVSGLSILIACVLVPLMMLISGASFFMKRRPAALTIKRPASGPMAA